MVICARPLASILEKLGQLGWERQCIEIPFVETGLVRYAPCGGLEQFVQGSP